MTDNEEKVYATVKRLAGQTGVNELSVAYACALPDVYDIVQRLVDRRVIERVGSGALRVRVSPEMAPIAIATKIDTVRDIAKPFLRKRKYFARLSRDPRFAALQMAARIRFQANFFGYERGERWRRELKRSLHSYRYATVVLIRKMFAACEDFWGHGSRQRL